MKKTIIFLACLLVMAPFAFAEESESPPGEARTVLQTQEQTQEQTNKDEQAYLQAMHQHQFREQNVLHIQNMIQEAQTKGLPTEPMQNKVHEGIAK